MILLGIRHVNGLVAHLRRLGDFGVHRHRQPLLGFFRKLRKGSHRLLVRHAGNHAVGGLIVKLEKMEMRVDLGGLEIGNVVVQPLAGQGPINTIVHVRPHDQRELLIVVGSNVRLFFMDHVEQPVGVDDGRLLALRRGQFNGQFDEMNVVILRTRPVRTQAPVPVFSRLGRSHRPGSVVVESNHLQPRSRIVIVGKRRAFSKMRRQPGPRHFPGGRLEPDGTPFSGFIALPFGLVLRVIADGGFPFAHRAIFIPYPIDHRGVIGLELTEFVVLMTRFALVAELHGDPVFQRHHRRVGLPIGLAALRDLELTAEPIHGRSDQLIRRHGLVDASDPVRQFPQRRHHVVLDSGNLQGVVDSPIPPHARDVVMGNVAVEQEVPGQPLTQP